MAFQTAEGTKSNRKAINHESVMVSFLMDQ